MIDIAYWIQYTLPIFYGGALFIMVLIAIIQVELKEYKKRKNKK